MGFIILCFMYYYTGRQSVKQLIDLKLFKLLLLSVLLVLLFDTASFFSMTFDFPYNREINIVSCTMYNVLLPLTTFLWFLYCGNKIYGDMNVLMKRFILYSIPIIFIVVLTLTSQLSGLIFQVDRNNVYSRGVYMWLTWLVIYGYAIGSYYLVGIKTKNKPALRPIRGVNACFYLFPLPPIILGAVQIFLPGTYLTGIGMVMSIFIIFANIHNKRLTEIAIEQHDQKMAQSRISTMLSQIKPHFVYNSLTAISDLCAGNAEAQEALVAFSDYFRVNMSSLNQKIMVSFETELNHIKHYLFLEKLRFEEKLQVVYDIQATGFKLPVLSVQPIVENAVSHGLFNKLGGGTVRIRTTEEEKDYVVTVIDDGVGYDEDTLSEMEKNNVGIVNVRNRIAAMCNGTLTIYSKPNFGTRVHIKIPKGE